VLLLLLLKQLLTRVIHCLTPTFWTARLYIRFTLRVMRKANWSFSMKLLHLSTSFLTLACEVYWESNSSTSAHRSSDSTVGVATRYVRPGVRIPAGVTRLGREADHSLPSSAEVKNGRSLPVYPIYAVMVWTETPFRNFRLLPQFRWDPRSSAILRTVEW
jgi:hypothetical protein